MSRAVAAAGKQAPFYAKTVVNAFVKGIHVSPDTDAIVADGMNATTDYGVAHIQDQYFDLEIQKHFDFVSGPSVSFLLV